MNYNPFLFYTIEQRGGLLFDTRVLYGKIRYTKIANTTYSNGDSMHYCIDTENVVWRDINGEIIILNLDSGSHYALNKTSSFIWSLIDGGSALKDVVEAFSENYQIPYARARRDVTSLINDLKRESLICAQNKTS